MERKMKLMMTVAKPEKLRNLKVNSSLPRLPKDLASQIPNYRKYFITVQDKFTTPNEPKKLPETSFTKLSSPKMSLLDKIESLDTKNLNKKSSLLNLLFTDSINPYFTNKNRDINPM